MSNSEMVQPTQGDREAADRLIRGADLSTLNRYEQYVAEAFASHRLACLEEAAKVCDTYAHVNFETAGDAVLLDPVLRGQGFTPENVEQSQQHQTDMLIHTSYFHAGQHLAAAIRAIGEA